MKANNPSQALAMTLVDEFCRNGVTHAVLAPGSRSAPLAFALASEDRLELRVNIDERSAAFLALGMARATDRPALVACTSGTAAANFLPAIVEASNDGVPLIALTADRPPELRGTGANQTIDQLKLYGDSVRWFSEVGAPGSHPSQPSYWRSTACRAVAEAMGSSSATPGPVHLNLSFREPLVPDPVDGFELDTGGRAGGRPWTETHPSAVLPTVSVIEELTGLIASTERGIIVAGAGAPEATSLLALARRTGYPLLAEPASNARIAEPAVAHYEALLRSQPFAHGRRADLVLRFGKTGLSRALGRYLESCGHHVGVVGPGTWLDPQRLADRLLHVDGSLLCDALLERIPDRRESGWQRTWLEAERVAKASLDLWLGEHNEPTEPGAARDLAAALPDGTNLVVASSMPVRDLDAVMDPRSGLRIFGNRGANGIDGFVSTTIGIAAASRRPTAALCGDLALLHDQNGLLEARNHATPCVFVVINNDGGGIFSFLEQAAYPEHFERVFGTPHGVDFGHVATTYACGYALIDRADALPSEVTERIEGPGVHLLEVRTDRTTNVDLHREMFAAVGRGLKVR